MDALVVEPTDVLVLNAADLEIESAAVDGQPVTFELDEAAERLSVPLGDRQPGPITFEAAVAAPINDHLKGFYRSTFTDDDGVERVIGTTQCQSTDARRIFPCFDEPDMKASFDIRLIVDPGLLAVSNGGEVARLPLPDGRVEIRFEPTMPMSTYLVAFVVGPLEATDPVLAGSVPVRIIHRPGQARLAEFAVEVAVAALEYFEDYYGIPYPTDKLDMIALPDFAMGAMENLGCITYREILVLVDPDKATQPELQNVADVINHEIAHMWFGDLVTMKWWNGIWLNEAFATFMEMKATDAFRPEWDRWTGFGTSRSQALDVDSLEATRPIEFPVHSPEEAEGMFDLLTYEKGAAVVRMLEQWLGAETFRDGIRLYLRRHLHANTETHHLWEALEEVSGRPVTDAMATWIFQGGHPLVEMIDGEVRQRRFGYRPGPGGVWTIPVRVRTTDGVEELVELSEPAQASGLDASRIVTANSGGHGFYRVRLPDETLGRIGAQGTGELSAVERFGVLDDTWALTLAGEIGVGTFLDLVDGYRDETDVAVWQRLIGAVGLIRHLADDDQLPPLQERVSTVWAAARHRLGHEPEAGESDRTRQLRGALLAAAGLIGRDPTAVASAEQIDRHEAADAELASAALQVLAAHGDTARFQEFVRRFEQATTPQSELRHLRALPLFPGAEQLDAVVQMCLDGSIRSQDAPFVLASALMHRRHGPAVWRQITDAWPAIVETYPSSTIVRLLSGIRWLADPETSAEVEEFVAAHPVPQGQQQLDQHLERLAVNRRLRTRVRDELPTSAVPTSS